MQFLSRIDPGWLPWITGVLACLLTAAATPAVISLARRFGWIAEPEADRWHTKPTALMGGAAMFFGTAVASALVVGDAIHWPLWAGAALMFVVGFVDDLRRLPPAAKLLSQVVAAGVLLVGGYAFAPGWSVWLSVPLTFAWVIGVTNAVNLLDNMDGLAAGIAAIAALFLAVFTARAGDLPDASIAAAVGGAALGFLIFNFNPAKIFMGDGGSLFLGYSVAALSTVLHGEASRPVSLAYYLVPIAVLAVPIFDTTLVTVLRTLAGRSISQGGRDHTSHRLVVAGLSERSAVLVLYGVSLVSAGLAMYLLYADIAFFYALVIYLLVGMSIFGVYLGRAEIYEQDDRTASIERIPQFFKFLMGRSWRVLMGMGADALLFVAAFIVAFHFRFESGLTPERETFILTALPIAIVVKLTVFYFMGMYRTMWRYAGTPEIVDLVKTTTIACVGAFAAVGVYYGFGHLAEGAFFIDWMIVTLSVIGSRLGYRGLHQYFSSRREGGKRILLCGSVETCLLALRVLREAQDSPFTAVGIAEKDASRLGMSAQGLTVLGTTRQISGISRRHKVDEVLITDPHLSREDKASIAEQCHRLSLRCSQFQLGYDEVLPGVNEPVTLEGLVQDA